LLGTKLFTEKELWGPAAIGAQDWQRAEMHLILNAKHGYSASQLMG